MSSGRDLSKQRERLLIYYPKHTLPPLPSRPPPGLASFLSRLDYTVPELKPNLSPLQLGFPNPAAGSEAAGPTPPGGGAGRTLSTGSTAPSPVPVSVPVAHDPCAPLRQATGDGGDRGILPGRLLRPWGISLLHVPGEQPLCA